MELSVIAHITSYNGEEVLPRFFKYYDRLSPFPDHTVFVINNCTDRTYEIIKDWCAEAWNDTTIIPLWFVPDLIKRCKSEYAGLAIARQEAWNYVRRIGRRYDYAWQLDDDLLLRTRETVEIFKDWDWDVVGGAYARDFPDGRFLTAKWLNPNNLQDAVMAPQVFAPFMEPTVVGGGCIFMRRKVFMDPRCYVFPLLGNAAEDFGFCLRMRDAGYKIMLDGITDIGHLVVPSRANKAWTQRDDMLEWEYEG